MASVIRIGEKWRAQVRRAGAAHTKTFGSESKARAWASSIEAALEGAKEDAAVSAFSHQPWKSLYAGGKPQRGLPVEIAALPRLTVDRCCGVYFLFHGSECVYVGQSDNVFGRVRQHFPSKMFDSFSWLQVAQRDLDRVEREYIEAISPRLNIAHRGTRAGRKMVTTGRKAA